MIGRGPINWTKKSGVTILEVLVVLAIIALIAGVAGPRLVGYVDRARGETAELQIEQIVNALQLFYIDVGRYPTEAEGLTVLIDAPGGEESWRGPYLETTGPLTDPWGRDYIFEATGENTRPNVLSYGRDGARGGSGSDADLGG